MPIGEHETSFKNIQTSFRLKLLNSRVCDEMKGRGAIKMLKNIPVLLF